MEILFTLKEGVNKGIELTALEQHPLYRCTLHHKKDISKTPLCSPGTTTAARGGGDDVIKDTNVQRGVN